MANFKTAKLQNFSPHFKPQTSNLKPQTSNRTLPNVLLSGIVPFLIPDFFLLLPYQVLITE
jgi:hypothetical protein